MKRMKWVFIAIGAAVVAGLLLRPRSPTEKPEAGQLVVTRKMAVEAVTAAPGRIRTLYPTFGVIEPQAAVDLSAQSAGQVTKVLFKEGDSVQTGQPLVKLDDRTVKAELEAAKAGSIHDRSALERSERLAQKGIKSAAAVDDSRTSLVKSQAGEQVRAANLSLMTITAPFSGIVGPSEVEIGSFVSAGQKIVRIEDRSRLRVTFRVAEKVLPLMHPGLPIEATAESIGAKAAKGIVTMVDPSVEPDSRSVLLRAQLEKTDGAVYPGLFVHINIILGDRPDALLVPRQALVASLAGNFLYRIDDGVVHRVKVVLGEREGDMVEIVRGLVAGDRVVAVGQFKLEEGMPVETTPYSSYQ